jgi:NADH-quinone oxidoreductase subunit G
MEAVQNQSNQSQKPKMIIDNIPVPIGDERNLLELIRKANIEIPTFCYHSELSQYGACRLCLVEVKGRGLQASCSIKPEPGLEIRTNTPEIREIRKIVLELLLANHNNTCNTCEKSSACKLRELAEKLGVREIRFKKRNQILPIDSSSNSLVRDPNKCILCGDCVRYCKEVQTIGAIDFAFRGKNTVVVPSFEEPLAHVECVNCGQCAAVCPTAAIVPKSETQKVWEAVANPNNIVIAQIAPAVRVAIGEEFGMPDSINMMGKIAASLKRIGFKYIFDTSYAADLTVIEEANELMGRIQSQDKRDFPLFSSCCPAWVKFAEQYYPELLGDLSTCKSPQQMFGSLIKLGDTLHGQQSMIPKEEGKSFFIVSIMPCTAKKYEANRAEFSHNGVKEVDAVITTQELAKMIKESGILFDKIAPEPLNLPFGFATGAGVIFGNSGGVSEAVLRYAAKKVFNNKDPEFVEIRNGNGIKIFEYPIGGRKIRLGVVSGLKNARKIIKDIKDKKIELDFVEVMACPNGCIGGAGQPIPHDLSIRKQRAQALYDIDKSIPIRESDSNPYIQQVYNQVFKEPNSELAHHMLHTEYSSKKRLDSGGIELMSVKDPAVKIQICVGTNCHLRKSQELIADTINLIETNELEDRVSVAATFCMEKCGKGPNAKVNEIEIEQANFEKIKAAIETELKKKN